MKRFYSRADVYKILSSNGLGAEVSYRDRPERPKDPPDDWIVFYPGLSTKLFTADDSVHARRLNIEVVHFHKSHTASIAKLIADHFLANPSVEGLKQGATGFFGTYYNFEILTDWGW